MFSVELQIFWPHDGVRDRVLAGEDAAAGQAGHQPRVQGNAEQDGVAAAEKLGSKYRPKPLNIIFFK